MSVPHAGEQPVLARDSDHFTPWPLLWFAIVAFNVTGRLPAGMAVNALVMLTEMFGGSAETAVADLAQPFKSHTKAITSKNFVEQCIIVPSVTMQSSKVDLAAMRNRGDDLTQGL